MRLPRIVVAVLAAALLASGCSSEDSAGEALPAEATVEEVLASTASAMAEIESAAFRIEQTGADVFIDADEIVRFIAAEGRYAAPSSADAIIRVEALGVATEVGAIAIDGTTFITNPLTGRWEQAPPEFSFDPAVLFAPETGWSALLDAGLTDAQLVSAADADPVQIRGTVAADRIATLTGGLVDEPSEVDLFVAADTSLVTEVRFDVTVPTGDTSWTLVVEDYGADVSIEAPEVGSTS